MLSFSNRLIHSSTFLYFTKVFLHYIFFQYFYIKIQHSQSSVLVMRKMCTDENVRLWIFYILFYFLFVLYILCIYTLFTNSNFVVQNKLLNGSLQLHGILNVFETLIYLYSCFLSCVVSLKCPEYTDIKRYQLSVELPDLLIGRANVGSTFIKMYNSQPDET